MRRFGIEIEFEGDMDDAIASLRAAGLGVKDERRRHTGNDPTDWMMKYDGSVSRGGELVSPPLDFDDPAQRAQVTTAVQALQDAGMRPSQATGIHVHIEAKNYDGTPLTGKQMAAIARFFYKFEDAIYRIASSGWNTIRTGASTYCKPVPEATAREIMKVRTIEELKNVWDGHTANGRGVLGQSGRHSRYGRAWANSLDRYYAVNYRSYWVHGTVEFRVFNGSVNPRRVQTYLALCMAIVDDARNGYSRSVAKSYRLGSMEQGTVSENAVLLRLQQILTTDSKDTKRVMSKEDWKNLRVLWKDSKPQRRFVGA
jgi:hypothetical protein